MFLYTYICVCVKCDYLVKITDSYGAVHKVQTVLMMFCISVECKVNRVVRSTAGPRKMK